MRGRRRYRVGQALAAGGFGIVYRAEWTSSGGFSRPVALKVLNIEGAGTEEYAQRLRDEARMLGLIRHRAIVEVHGLVRLRNRWTVVMELVDGADLQQLFDLGPVPPSVALQLIAEIAGALHVAYTADGPGGQPLRLLHRDIKPGNVRLTPDGDVKILDFGAGRAEFTGREARTEAFTFGSMTYMAPERLDGIDSHAADVYSLGVMAFEMLTASAFGRSSAAPGRHATKLRGVMDHLWRATGESSEELVRLVGGMLSYDSASRPDARAVERFCIGLQRSEVDGEFLRDWAETAVPRAQANAPAPFDADLTGLEFDDSGFEIPETLQMPTPMSPVDLGLRSDGAPRAAFGSGSATLPPADLSDLFTAEASPPVPPQARTVIPRSPAPTGSTPQPARLPRWVPVVGILGTLLIVALIFWRYGQEGPGPQVQGAPPAQLSAPTVPLRLDAPSSPTPAEVDEPAPPKTRRTRRSSPEPKAPSATGRVEVSGYAHEVRLTSAEGRFPPGDLPPGRYKVQARFTEEEGLKSVATIDVRAGQILQLNCSRVYGTCSPRK